MMKYIVLYAEDYCNDVWLEYCDICGVGYDTTSIKINFNSECVEAYSDDDDEEDGEANIRYYVCGLGYDEYDRITDHEWSFGDFDTYEEAYELFVKLQCKDKELFFTKAPDVYQLAIQLEECEEYEDEAECVDVRNEWIIFNPRFKEKE